MATNIGNLNVKLTAGIGGFAAGMSKGGRHVDTLRGKVDGLTSKIGKLAVVGGSLLGAGGLAAGLGTGVKLAADYEQAQVAMTTMIGSATKAEAVLSDLNDFAASTPFEMPGLTDATKKLLAFGSTPDGVIGELRMLGDIAAGIGQPVDQLAELYGKARVSGRLFAEDINQLTGRGIPIIAALAKQFGVADSQVKSLVQSGQVNFGHLQAALRDLTAEGSQFGGMMAAQSQTLTGRWSTLRDNVGLALRDFARVGLEIFNVTGAIEGLTVAISTGVPPMIQWVNTHGDAVQTLLVLVPSIYATKKALDLFNVSLATTRSIVVGGAIYSTLGKAAMAIGYFGGVIPAAVAGLKALAASTLALKAATLGVIAVFGTITAAFIKSRIEGKRYSDTVWEMGRSLGIFDSEAARLTDAYKAVSDAGALVAAAERAIESARNDAARLTAAEDLARALEGQIQARKAMLKIESGGGSDLIQEKLTERLTAVRSGIESMQAAAQRVDLSPVTVEATTAGDALAEAKRELDGFAASVYDATRTPVESFVDQFNRLDAALRAGAFDSVDTAERGLFAALDDAIGNASSAELDQLAQQVNRLYLSGRLTRDLYTQMFGKVADAIANPKDQLGELEAAGRSVFEATRTPLERYEARIGELSDLLNAGAISYNTYGRAVRQAREELEATADAAAAGTNTAMLTGSAAALLDQYRRDQESTTLRLSASDVALADAGLKVEIVPPDFTAQPSSKPLNTELGLDALRDDLGKKQLAEAEEQTRKLGDIERNTRNSSATASTSLQVVEII